MREHPDQLIAIKPLMKQKVLYRSNRVLSGKIGTMTKSIEKALSQVLGTNATDKEERRASFYKKYMLRSSHEPRTSAKKAKSLEIMKPIYEASCELELDEDFGPQFGLSDVTNSINVIDFIMNHLGISSCDDIAQEIEGACALFLAVVNSSNMIGALSSVVLYVRHRYSSSLSSEILQYVKELFGMIPQAGSETDEQEPQWLEFMRDIKNNWKRAQASPFFPNFSRVLSLLVLSGLYSVSDLTFSIGDFKVFEPNCKLVCGGAIDVANAVSDIVVYFCERTYHAIKHKSLTPFFYTDLETVDLEMDFAHMEADWELFLNGNLQSVRNTTPHDFMINVAKMQDRLRGMIITAKGLDKRLLEHKFRRCLDIGHGIALIQANSTFRPAPLAIEYYGRSGVGKSTVSAQTSYVIFKSAGIDTSDNSKYNLFAGKKHWDGIRSDVREIKIDDHANTKATFVDHSPCEDIIRIQNNIPFSPPQAELDKKGKVFVQPDLLTVTTNVQDLDAHTYSNNPTSIQRRMHIIVEVRVKKEFQKIVDGQCAGIDSKKVIDKNTVDGKHDAPLYDDIWELDVKEVVPSSHESSTAGYRIVEHEGKPLKGISMKTWLGYATVRFHEHRHQQETIGKSFGKRPDVAKCPVDGCIHLKATCPDHDHGPQFGLESVKQFCTRSTEELYNEASEFWATWDWLPYLPQCAVDSNLFAYFMCIFNGRNLINVYKKHTKCNIAFVLIMQLLSCVMTSGITLFFFVNLTFMLGLYYQYWLISCVKSEYHRQLINRNTLNLVQKRWRDNIGKMLMVSCKALGTIYLFSKVYKYMYGNFAQGCLEPKSELDIAERDSQQNVWASVSKRPLPSTQKSIEHVPEVVDKKVLNNLFYATFEGEDDVKRMGDVFFIRSNFLLAPNHYFTESRSKTIKLTCYRDKSKNIGGMFVTRIDIASSFLIPGTDMRVCYSPSGGSFPDMVDYFPTGNIVDHPFHMFWRAKSGEVTKAFGYAQAKRTTNGVCTFDGGVYANLSIDTFQGMCGAVIISDTKQTCITGLHLGGIEGSNHGCFGSFTGEQLRNAIDVVSKVPGVMDTGLEGEFRPHFMGVDILTHKEINKKSPVNFLPENSQFMWHGTCVGQSTSRSDVRQTPISDYVSQVTGQENLWGGPVMKPEWFGWQTAMANSSNPAEPVPHDVLQRSVEDYRAPLMEIAMSEPWCREKPLTDHENLCGRIGAKFIDAIPLDTSIGYPKTGPKRNYVIELEPTPEKPNNRVFTPEIMDVIHECEEVYKQGKRNHFIAKACKKDEILLKSKRKCRIFYANSTPFTWLVRKYYLPVARLLQMNPLISECAVGINCHSQEWDQLHEFVFKHGEDRIIGGDYGKYDQKLPSQKLLAAIDILIEIAKCMDYSETDITVMKAMAGDIVYSLIAYNGDLLGIQSGTHISGNSLTVILNGISGSLNLRDYFFSRYSTELNFRDAVALITYGDDNAGSVAPGFDDFNIKGASEYLAEYGQTYTMPDKESELRPYLHEDEFEFLKRKSVFHPKLGCRVGALLESSIFKSLHCYLRPKKAPLTPSEACAQNIDTSLREWFNHGEDVYELRRQQMQTVAQNAGLEHMCMMLDVSYDEAVADWKYKYANGPKPQKEVEAFGVQSCFEQDCL